jgi:hypothetical protein
MAKTYLVTVTRTTIYRVPANSKEEAWDSFTDEQEIDQTTDSIDAEEDTDAPEGGE